MTTNVNIFDYLDMTDVATAKCTDRFPCWEHVADTEKYVATGNVSKVEIATVKALNKRLNVQVERPVAKCGLYLHKHFNNGIEKTVALRVTVFCNSESEAYDIAEQFGNGSFVQLQGSIKKGVGKDGKEYLNFTVNNGDTKSVLKYKNKEEVK